MAAPKTHYKTVGDPLLMASLAQNADTRFHPMPKSILAEPLRYSGRRSLNGAGHCPRLQMRLLKSPTISLEYSHTNWPLAELLVPAFARDKLVERVSRSRDWVQGHVSLRPEPSEGQSTFGQKAVSHQNHADKTRALQPNLLIQPVASIVDLVSWAGLTVLIESVAFDRILLDLKKAILQRF